MTRGAILLCTALLAVLPEGASAQRRPDRYYDQGQRLYREGYYEDALAAFERSYRERPSWQALRALATTLEYLERVDEAVDRLDALNRDHASDMPSRERARVSADLRRLSARVGTLIVETVPGDANVVIGTRVLTPGQPARMSPGEHEVVVSRDGYGRRTERVRIRAGGIERVRVALESEGEVASIDVRTRPVSAEVFVDGERRGLAPLGLSLPLGGHRVRAELPGYHPAEREVTLRSGAWEQLQIDLAPRREIYEEWWFWALIVLGVGAAVATPLSLWATRSVAPQGTIGNVVIMEMGP